MSKKINTKFKNLLLLFKSIRNLKKQKNRKINFIKIITIVNLFYIKYNDSTYKKKNIKN